jgi:hypothetical protein
MLILPPPEYRGRRTRVTRQALASLQLVSGLYSFGAWIELTFNQPISIGTINVAQISVNDGEYQGGIYTGMGVATLLNATTVKVLLAYSGDSGTDTVLLSAGSANGIAASSGAGLWIGVTNFAVPHA